HLKLQIERRSVHQERALSSSSSLDDKESEDIVKCFCRIFMRIGTFNDKLGKSKITSSSASACRKERISRDPYGICS
ncbi:hypothetical protein VIGAN_10176400, partial [Vigna angularis var. angularis]